MRYLAAILMCVVAAACGSDDKALRSPGAAPPTVGAAGAPPTNPLPPITGIAGQVAGGAGIGGTEVAVANPFGSSGNNFTTGAAGAPGVSSTPIGVAGSGF